MADPRVGPDAPDAQHIPHPGPTDRLDPTPDHDEASSRGGPLERCEPLPDGIREACSHGEAWAVRLSCVWNTLDRYVTVRRRHDRLPAHHLLCHLARDVSLLADVDVPDPATLQAIARRLEAACDDPLGDEPAAAIALLLAQARALAPDCAA